MRNAIKAVICAGAFAVGASVVWAKIPAPPPLDEKGKAAAEEKKAKDSAAAEKAKADLAAAEDRTVANRNANLKKAGKPIPKPTAVKVASAPPTGAAAKPEGNTKKAEEKAKSEAPAKK